MESLGFIAEVFEEWVAFKEKDRKGLESCPTSKQGSLNAQRRIPGEHCSNREMAADTGKLKGPHLPALYPNLYHSYGQYFSFIFTQNKVT